MARLTEAYIRVKVKFRFLRVTIGEFDKAWKWNGAIFYEISPQSMPEQSTKIWDSNGVLVQFAANLN